MERSESTVSGRVTADWLTKCVTNRSVNASLVADMVSPASAARSVSSVYFIRKLALRCVGVVNSHD